MYVFRALGSLRYIPDLIRGLWSLWDQEFFLNSSRSLSHFLIRIDFASLVYQHKHHEMDLVSNSARHMSDPVLVDGQS